MFPATLFVQRKKTGLLTNSSLILSQSLNQNPLQHWVSSNSQEFSFDLFQFQSQEGNKEEERQCYVISSMFASFQGTFLKIKKKLKILKLEDTCFPVLLVFAVHISAPS